VAAATEIAHECNLTILIEALPEEPEVVEDDFTVLMNVLMGLEAADQQSPPFHPLILALSLGARKVFAIEVNKKLSTITIVLPRIGVLHTLLIIGRLVALATLTVLLGHLTLMALIMTTKTIMMTIIITNTASHIGHSHLTYRILMILHTNVRSTTVRQRRTLHEEIIFCQWAVKIKRLKCR